MKHGSYTVSELMDLTGLSRNEIISALTRRDSDYSFSVHKGEIFTKETYVKFNPDTGEISPDNKITRTKSIRTYAIL